MSRLMPRSRIDFHNHQCNRETLGVRAVMPARMVRRADERAARKAARRAARKAVRVDAKDTK